MRLPALAAVLLTLAASSRAAGFDPETSATALEARADAEALAEAALLRLGLGQLDQAHADAALLEHKHGGARPDLVARVTLARARRHAGLGEWEDLRVLLTKSLPALDRRASLDDRLEARALLGRALVNLGRHEEAAARHRLAIALGKAGQLGERGREAVAEATFRLAEVERAKAEAITLAPYAGKGDRESVTRYLSGPVAQWMPKRMYAIEVAENAYQRVLGIDAPPPVPPWWTRAGGDPNAPTAPWGRDDSLGNDGPPPSPRWGIAAASQVALSWDALVRIARALPVLPWPSGPVPGASDLTYEDLRGWYGHRDYEVLDVPKWRAKQACETALRLALQHRIADDHTRACELWLSRNFAAEWRLVDDLPPKIAAPFAAGPFAPAPR